MPGAQRRALDLGVTAGRDAVATLAGGGEAATGRILFGDLHVHTTYSLDAFVYSLPVFGGEGAHPPADACDFARYCASLDFFALTDHAESLTPQRWREEKDTIRACDARAGDPADPDLVAFLGFEWTQVGATPETHDGHRNVIFRGLADPELPPRPIGAKSGSTPLERQLEFTRSLQRLDPLHWRRYSDFVWVLEHVSGVAPCPAALDPHALPPDCAENTASVEVLYEKLRRLGLDSIVIPHGTTWGSYTPLGSSLETQLTVQKYDPSRERLIELFSGHGSSEPYRPFRDSVLDADGREVCAPPTGDYLPCCWQAGEIMRSRCGDLPAAECEGRVQQARRLALEAGTAAELVFLDARPEEWLDCGQCRDCFKPTFGPRPQASVQYGLALSSPDEVDAQGRPLRFRWGFVSSSDNHAARAGAGYKELGRHGMTDAMGVRSAFYYDRGFNERVEAQKDPRRPRRTRPSAGGLTGSERLASFLYPGGLVAVHAEARTRDAVWDALGRRQVYGTSGPRILLWFDLLNGPGGRAPMGSEVEMTEAPRFEVRAVGSLVEQPGCPTASLEGLSAERLEYLCRGECHNPGDARHPIVAIEIVRIRPRHEAGEDPGAGIEDPWRRFECPPDPRGCVVSFEDADPAASRRDVVYYARALQEETPAVNGANLRTEFDAEGRPLQITPCYGHYKTPFEDDCLAPVQERAWSSPVYVDRPRRR